MKKGDVVWIKYNGFYHCSEVVKIVYFNDYFEVDLLPIIGDCTNLLIDNGDNLDDCISVTVFLNNDFWGTEGIASYNFEKLLV